MSVTTTAPTQPLITGGLTAAAVAAAATATVAAAGEFAGISLVVGGAPIPVSGFAYLAGILHQGQRGRLWQGVQSTHAGHGGAFDLFCRAHACQVFDLYGWTSTTLPPRALAPTSG
jgi:hypothetical protein